MKKNNNTQIIPIGNYITKFKNNISFGMEAIRNAAKAYVEATRKYADAQQVFARNFPSITERTWGLLMKIGSGEANANVIICSQSFRDKVSRLPVKDQNKLLGSSGFIKIYSAKKDKVEDVRFGDITLSQERIVFDESTGKVRSVSEQKKYIKAMYEAEKLKEKPIPYKLIGNTLIVNCKCEILVSEIIRMVREKENGK